MAYERQIFKPKQVLHHTHMNKIDEWLCYICGKEIESGKVNEKGELVFSLCNGSTLNIGDIATPIANAIPKWTGGTY